MARKKDQKGRAADSPTTSPQQQQDEQQQQQDEQQQQQDQDQQQQQQENQQQQQEGAGKGGKPRRTIVLIPGLEIGTEETELEEITETATNDKESSVQQQEETDKHKHKEEETDKRKHKETDKHNRKEETDKHKETKETDKHKEKEETDKHKEETDKHKETKETDKHKEKEETDKHREKEEETDKHKHKEETDKHKHKEETDKHKEETDKHKHKEEETDKHKHKEKETGKHKEKETDNHKEKETDNKREKETDKQKETETDKKKKEGKKRQEETAKNQQEETEFEIEQREETDKKIDKEPDRKHEEKTDKKHKEETDNETKEKEDVAAAAAEKPETKREELGDTVSVPVEIQQAQDPKKAIEKALRFINEDSDAESATDSEESEVEVEDPLLESLTPEQKAVVVELQNAQQGAERLEKQFEKEVELLRYQYEKRLLPYYHKRAELLATRPKTLAAVAAAAAAGLKEEEIPITESTTIGTPGLPGFWLGVFERHKTIRDTLSYGDRIALMYLQDIQAEKRLRPEDGFKLTFLFSTNPFFSNSVLTKEFIMRSTGDDVIVHKTIGTDISWHEGMNLTKSISVSKQRNIRTKQQRIVQLVKDEDSFFNFFRFTQVPALRALKHMGKQEAQEVLQLLDEEYGLAVIFRDVVVPKAINVFLGLEDADETESDESSADE